MKTAEEILTIPDEPDKRKRGHYWVKLSKTNGEEWDIAFWDDNNECWWIYGDHHTFEDSEFDQIVETLITKPIDLSSVPDKHYDVGYKDGKKYYEKKINKRIKHYLDQSPLNQEQSRIVFELNKLLEREV